MFISDNFFKNPDLIVDWANNLDYPLTKTNYPGKRTLNLKEIDNNFYQELIEKILVAQTKHTYYVEANAHFQKIPSKYGSGLIHHDASHTAIIYLNKNDTAGTTLYTQNDIKPILHPFDSKPYWEQDDIETIEKLKEEYNSCYTEDIKVSGKYNRLIMFDGRQPHSGNSFDTEHKDKDEERLTLIIFFSVLGCKKPEDYIKESNL